MMDDSRQLHVELRGVSMDFGAAQVLRDVSFALERGQIGVIIGGSGGGKTTLLRIVVGLLRPTTGVVSIDGEDISRLSARQLRGVRAKSAMVFQYSALLDS